MTETLQEEAREAPEMAPEMPLHMRRDGFDPVPEMAALRDDEGVRQVETAFGMPAFLVARHADVKAVLADSARFSNDSRRAFDAPGAPKLSAEERDRMRARIEKPSPFSVRPTAVVSSSCMWAVRSGVSASTSCCVSSSLCAGAIRGFV